MTGSDPFLPFAQRCEIGKLQFCSDGRNAVESSKLGAWLQVAAHVGILAGLIIVGFQMKQASDLQRTQILRDETTAYMANEMSLIGEGFAAVWAKSIESPESLTLEELRLLDSYMWSHYVYRWMCNYRLHQAGLLDEADWKREVKIDAPYIFGNRYGKAWWANQKEHITLDENAIWFTREFVDYISAQADAVSETWTTGLVRGPLEHLGPSEDIALNPE